MSHSKTTKKGFSLYIEKWNPKAKKYINTCMLCGKQGYNPTIESDGFVNSSERRAINSELTKTLSPLSLDDYGMCSDCAKRINKQGEN